MGDTKSSAFEAARAIHYQDKDIAPQWAKVTKDCGTATPSPAMLASYNREALLAIGVARPLADAWGPLFASTSTKAKKYKPGRPCTAAEYAEHYDRDPENADLAADIARATDRKPWVVFKDRFRAAESARYIAWHMNEDIAPATVIVDGVPVAPVMPGDERRKEAKLYPVDPHTPGDFLDVENKSPRTGADFTGYTEEEIQATIMAYLKIGRMDDLSLQRLTEENRGKGAAAILKPWPSLAAAWANTKPEDRPKTKATKEKTSRNPPVAGGGDAPIVGHVMPLPTGPAPLVVILGHQTKAYASVRQSLVPLQQAGILRMWSEKDLRAGEFMERTIREKYTEASLFIALLDMYSLTSLGDVLSALIEAKRPVMPVVVGGCLWDMTDVARLSVLFKEQGRHYGTREEDGTTLAREVRCNLAALSISDVRPPPPIRLEVNDIGAAIIGAGLADSRRALLAGLPPEIVAGLPHAASASDQVYQDIGALQDMGRLLDGSRPLVKYLQSAATLAGPRVQARVFHDALRVLGK